MVGIFIGDTAPSKIYVGGSEVASVWAGDTKVRPSAKPITTPGIYRDETDGLISLSSDGSTWLTIADKNLGATSTNTTSTDSYGNYYQWGNNYGFPNSGSVTTSSTKVNASDYGPGNYYNSSTFITTNPRDSSNNTNLRGGVTGTNEAMQGPCNTGFHIPLNIEIQNLYDIGISLGAWTSSGVSEIRQYLKIPLSGYRNKTSVSGQGTNFNIWASNSYSTKFGYGMAISSIIDYDYWAAKNSGFNIRPFKNEAVQPDDSRTKLY